MQNGSRQTKRRPDFFLEKYVELEQLFPDLQFGFAILDKKLRYQHVSGQLIELSGIAGDNLRGKGIGEVTPHIAGALEPMLSRVMTEDRPCFEPAVTITTPGTLKVACTWQVRSYPLHAQDGKVQGAGIVVRDITEQKLREAAQAERLQFESLLATLSTTFINVRVNEVDDKIVLGLQKIVEFLGFDRSTVWRVDPNTGEMICTHSYELPGINPPLAVLPHAMVPVWNSMVKSGEIFKISDIDELPDRFWREKQYCRDRGGIRSIMFIPSQVGGVVEGFITFVSYSVIRTWPDDLIQRLRMLWDIFANALERKRADQKIQQALAEIRTLKDRLEAENVYLRDQIHIEYKPDEIIGQSAPISTVLRQLQQVAHTDATVLLLGETGTGKELLARAIHNLSSRRERTMIKVNCAALPAALIETELFGHEKGAYTGAAARRMGRFEAANGSTIFLDEIGELPLDLQAKLLRVLQEGQFERVGSTRPIEVDARVVAATNRDLAREVKEGRFREDLYYRLNVFPIAVPPLRERKEDIPLLVTAMVREFAGAFGKAIERVPKKTMDDLMHYSWPGNIRELRNVIERAMILSNGATLQVDLPDSPPAMAPRTHLLQEVERLHITTILEQTGWRIRGRKGAAELLGLKPTTLESRMLKLGISRAAASSEIS